MSDINFFLSYWNVNIVFHVLLVVYHSFSLSGWCNTLSFAFAAVFIPHIFKFYCHSYNLRFAWIRYKSARIHPAVNHVANSSPASCTTWPVLTSKWTDSHYRAVSPPCLPQPGCVWRILHRHYCTRDLSISVSNWMNSKFRWEMWKQGITISLSVSLVTGQSVIASEFRHDQNMFSIT